MRGQSAVDTFDPNANGRVRTIVVQPDGKILIGGDFTGLTPNGGPFVTRNYIARLNTNGTVDTTFNPNADATVRTIAVQSDGRVLAGGDFALIGGQSRQGIARLNATTGAAESFNTNSVGIVYAIALQTNGQVLASGGFQLAGEFVLRRLVRLHAATGAADSSFNPDPNGRVDTIAVQSADGKILVGGIFATIGGQPRSRIARLDGSTGAADSFNPNASNQVASIVVQSDGKVWAGGLFTGIGGQTRNYLARLDGSTGAADSADPSPNNTVLALAIQTDGKILVGGNFTSIGGQSRNYLARLNPGTGLADSFNPNPNNGVESIALQGEGKVLVGGNFTSVSARTRNRIARLETQPRLNIQRSANTNVVLSWITNFTGFTLEASANLNTNIWNIVSPAPVVSGTNNVVTNAANNPGRFYRLRP